MPNSQAAEIYEKGLQALSNGHDYLALVCFEQATNLEQNPLYCSYLALCLAKARNRFEDAITICGEAMEKDPANSIHYLNLGRIYILAGQREKALEALRHGLQHQKTDEILRELEMLGMRKRPVFPFLRRGNPLNKYCGLLLKKVGYR